MITRYNYEEFFLLYVDNELSAAERNAVEEFVQQNADLKEELIMIQQSILKPESNVSFENKNLLLKQTEENSLINLNNYEEYFLLYIDNELDHAAKKDVEIFIQQNPSLQIELNLLQQTKPEPDADIVFEGKEILYKKEEKRKPIPFAWMSAAAVAILLVTGFLLYNKTEQPNIDKPKEIAGNKINSEKDSLTGKNKKEDVAVTQQAVDSFNKTEDAKKQMAVKEDKKEKQAAQYAINNQKKNKINNNKDNNIAAINPNPGKQETQLKDLKPIEITKTNTGNEKEISTSLAVSKLNVEPNNLIAKADKPDETVKDNTEVTYATQVAMTYNNVEDIDTDNTSAKKNKLRGIFRKVSRVFEKTTNVDDGNKRSVSIGSFQIALK